MHRSTAAAASSAGARARFAPHSLICAPSSPLRAAAAASASSLRPTRRDQHSSTHAGHRSSLASTVASSSSTTPNSSRSYGNSAASYVPPPASEGLPPPSLFQGFNHKTSSGNTRTSSLSSIFPRRRDQITRLPSPLPLDVVASPSKTIETISILKACLATGLIGRAEKLFDSLRQEYYLRKVNVDPRPVDQQQGLSRAAAIIHNEISPFLYDLMIDAYLFRAASLAHNANADPFSSFGTAAISGKLVDSPAAAAKAAATTAAIRTYVQRAWALFGMMHSQESTIANGEDAVAKRIAALQQQGSHYVTAIDPLPTANTISVMMRGIIRLKQLGAYPSAIRTSHTGPVPSLQNVSGAAQRAASSNSADAEFHNEIKAKSTYAHIPSGIIKPEAPGLDVLLSAAHAHAIPLEEILKIYSENIHSFRSSSESATPASPVVSTSSPRLPNGFPTASSSTPASASERAPLPQPSTLELLSEATATADRMGNVALTAQLRTRLEEEKANVQQDSHTASVTGRDVLRADGRAKTLGVEVSVEREATPEEIQATVPEVEPVLTVSSDFTLTYRECTSATAHTDLNIVSQRADNNPGMTPNADGLVEPFNLTNLKENLSVVAESRKMFSDPYDRQDWLEISSIEAAQKRLAREDQNLQELGLSQAAALKSKPLQALMWTWYQALQSRLKAEIERLSQSENKKTGQTDVLPFLKLLPLHKLALLPILEMMRITGAMGLAGDGVRTTRTLIAIGKAVESEALTYALSQNPRMHAQLKEQQRKLQAQGILDPETRQEVARLGMQSTPENTLEEIMPKWTQGVRARVGGLLVQLVLETAKVHRSKVDEEGALWEEDQPAFYSTFQYVAGKKIGVIKLNDEIGSRLHQEKMNDMIQPRYLPMLVPPRLWETTNRGGYLTARTSLMRFKDSAEQGSYLRAASQNDGLEPIKAGLDVLGQTAWTVNTDVLRVMTELWNRGESVGKLPPKKHDVPEPERPAECDTDLASRAVYLKRLRAWVLGTAALHSKRCDINYKLEIARAYVGERFYLPHNVDFRGRAYPIPPHLHHLGSDLSRGLLMFADAKPLRETGLRWLRVHLANLYGYDKASFSDRVKFALDNEENIRKSAEDPINFRWWAQAEEPFQCLATCAELARAMSYPDGPEAYPSRLPVHQDGTCNGLQHYAALGGDMEGAKQVNLSRGDAPSDVYTGVAELVIKRVAADAEAGNELAKLLVGKITRKVVKQTVMTTVYGVTLIGAKDQVQKRLYERKDFPAEWAWEGAHYLAKLIINSIGDLFSGAHAIQNWLHHSASIISKSIPLNRIEYAVSSERPSQAKERQKNVRPKNPLSLEQMTSVIWQTPLGLPVVQPYRRLMKKQMATAVQT
ncbi:DNA-directed RNA polymerase, partial [Tilletia horrida]